MKAVANLVTILRVLVTQAKDVPGQWIGHCLELDVVTQGDSPQHALEMTREAVVMVIGDDLRNELNPFERSRAPVHDWETFVNVVTTGQSYSSVENSADVGAVASWLRIELAPRDARDAPALPRVETLPPAWQMAAIQNVGTHDIR